MCWKRRLWTATANYSAVVKRKRVGSHRGSNRWFERERYYQCNGWGLMQRHLWTATGTTGDLKTPNKTIKGWFRQESISWQTKFSKIIGFSAPSSDLWSARHLWTAAANCPIPSQTILFFELFKEMKQNRKLQKTEMNRRSEEVLIR